VRVLIATDAWHPQVNGVVRTLTSLAASAKRLGVEIEFLTPEGFPSVALPTYSNLRLALPTKEEIARRIEAAKPDAIHVATEGPIGFSTRAYCRRRALPFTSSYRSPQSLSRDVPHFCLEPLMGTERAAIHRSRADGSGSDEAPARHGLAGGSVRAGLSGFGGSRCLGLRRLQTQVLKEER
jgi:hypothetical protein